MVSYRASTPAFGVVDLTADEDGDYVVPNIVVLDEDEDEDTVDLTEDEARGRQLTPGALHQLEAQLSKLSTSDIPAGYKIIAPVSSPAGVYVQEGLDLELEDGDFVRIKCILEHQHTGTKHVMGILFRRTRRVNNMLKKNLNELCAIIQDASNADNPALGSYGTLVIRPLESVLQVRHIVVTNQSFPAFSFRTNGESYRNAQTKLIEETETLVCRWKFVEYVSLKDGRVVEGAVIQISDTEADDNKSAAEVAKKRAWLPQTMESPSKKRNFADSMLTASDYEHDIIDLTSDDDDIDVQILDDYMVLHAAKRTKSENSTPVRRSPKTSHARLSPSPTPKHRLYSYGDICAGAGGMTRGAYAAGLNPRWLLDHWDPACNTLELNWPGKSVRKDIFDFCHEDESTCRVVDVLHISFPCQTYAACHTIPGKNDDANRAAGFSVIPLLTKTRPRVVTFEQTATFLTRHGESFSALIHQLTVIGYNVRWKLFICSDYGNVQPRKRLFMIASCPGEPLPPFPKPTHGGGRAPLTTIQNRLSLLPRHIRAPWMHNQFTPKQALPYDAHKPLAQAITCDGGKGDLHPSGKRSFNMQELALLAGFPPEHKFAETGLGNLRKQIGNAVPSMVAKVIFESVIGSMRKADRLEREYKPEVLVID